MSSSRQLDRGEPRVGALLRLAHENVQAAVYKRTAAAGYQDLRPAHFRLFRFPGVDGTRPTELARRLETTKQALNPLINDLERWGYLKRLTDPEDRRGRALQLTARGHELTSTIKSLHEQIESSWSEQVGPRRFQTVLEVLRELADQYQTTRLPECRNRRRRHS